MAAPKTLRFGSMVLLLFALFVSSSFVTAQEPGQIVDAGLDGCSAYLTFIMPYPDEQAPRGASRLAPLNTVYVLVFDEGVLITAYEVTGEAGLTYTVWHPIDRYYGFEGFVFNLNPNSDDDGSDYYDFIAVEVLDSVVASCLETVTDCPYPQTSATVQGRLLNPTQAYYDATLDAATNITLPAGSSWWILDAKDGFYKLFIACQARYLWVPAEAVSANFDPVWNGAPLPDAGSPSD